MKQMNEELAQAFPIVFPDAVTCFARMIMNVANIINTKNIPSPLTLTTLFIHWNIPTAPVTLTLPEASTVGFDEFEDPSDFTYSLTWNSGTYIFTYTYSDSDSTFENARLEVVRLAPANSSVQIPSCNETKTTSSGVITCDISASSNVNGTYMATGFLSRTSDVNKIVERILKQKIASIVNMIGLDGVLWSFFIFIGIVMLGVYKPSLGIISGILGVIFLKLLGLMEITTSAIIAVIAIGVVLLWGVQKQWTIEGS